MLGGGEDPVFIARRLVIFASEDVGNADINGLTMKQVYWHGTPGSEAILHISQKGEQ